MKFNISQQELNKTLSFVSRAVTTRSTMPILKGILLKVDDSNTLSVSASDMDLSIETKLNVSNSESGSIVLPAKLFTEIIRKLPNEDISISLGEFNNVSIKNSSSEFKIIGMSADEFPELGTVNENKKIIINKEIFRNMIQKTAFAASIDASRGVIVGVLIEMKEDEINMAALDGFRMAVSTEHTSNNQVTDVIISSRILTEISKMITDGFDENEDVELILDEKKAVILSENSKIILRIIEGEFLNYKNLIPQEFQTIINIDKDLLINSIERASLFAKEGRNNLIKLSFVENNLKITSQSEAGNVDENIPIKKTGDDIEIGFNSKYLLDGLKVIEENDILIKLNTNVNPCIIEPLSKKNYIYLILPVRIMV